MPRRLFFLFGSLTLIPYLVAWFLGDLRAHTVGFEVMFFIAFGLYAGATAMALRMSAMSRWEVVWVFVLALAMMGILVFTAPTLSDDMYRYVWDGRVQAQGFSPYRYPPSAGELAALRDQAVWPHINRKAAVTVYPPAAEMAYAALWRIWPDNVRWFQMAMALGALLAGGLLVGLLQDLGRSPARVAIYLWAPLLVFETAHSAHVDGLILPLLVGAWWARTRERDSLVGVLLGLATAVKFYPALLLPALWRPDHGRGRWRLLLAFVVTVAACYAPYVATSGSQVLGFLPNYIGERFNLGLASFLVPLLSRMGIDPNQGILGLILLALGILSLWMVLRPAQDGETAVRRSIWLMGAFTLLSQNLFPWYMLWVLPLVAIFLELDVDSWTGWWLFCGLVALSYTFFIVWRPVAVAQWLQFLPLYALLLVDLGRRLAVRYGYPMMREA